MTEPKPAISVIVPAYNSGATLPACLAALQAATGNFETIVVDDASPDPVTGDGTIRILRLDKNVGPAAARNRGAKEARAPTLVFLDADVATHPDSIAKFAAYLDQNPEVSAVMGSYDDNPPAPGIISQYKNLQHHYVHQHGQKLASTFWSGLGAVRRQAFESVGGFDESWTEPAVEDIELGMRMRQAGMTIHLVPSIQATHLKHWTLVNWIHTDLFRRAVPWTRLMLASADMPLDLNLRLGQRLSAFLVYALVGCAALTPFLGVVATLLAGGCIAALLALNFDFYRALAAKRGGLFALASIPLHWLYFGYSVLGAAIAWVQHKRNQPAG